MSRAVTGQQRGRITEQVNWAPRYLRRLRVSDACVLAYVILGTHLLWFGAQSPDVASNRHFPIGYVMVSVLLGAAWMTALSLSDTRDPRVLGEGGDEYQRVVAASLRLFGAVAIVAFLAQAQAQVGRGYLAVAFPIGTAGGREVTGE